MLIVNQRADGTYDVNALLSAASAVNAALAAFYTQSRAADAIAAELDKQTRADNALAQSIEAAAQAVLQ